jgi:hypothetical protein
LQHRRSQSDRLGRRPSARRTAEPARAGRTIDWPKLQAAVTRNGAQWSGNICGPSPELSVLWRTGCKEGLWRLFVDRRANKPPNPDFARAKCRKPCGLDPDAQCVPVQDESPFGRCQRALPGIEMVSAASFDMILIDRLTSTPASSSLSGDEPWTWSTRFSAKKTSVSVG